MKFSRSPGILVIASLAIIFWSCSTGPKPSPDPSKPSAETPPQTQPSPRQGQAEKSSPQKTIIPPEENNAIAPEGPPQGKKNPGEKEDAALFEDALNKYQEAKASRERGDLDAALKALDEAYGIILKVKLSPDSALLQEKNDLRLLIAQRIQEIYASRRNPIDGNHNSIPLVENKWFWPKSNHSAPENAKSSRPLTCGPGSTKIGSRRSLKSRPSG